ncbi:hypothetical protein QGN32_08805 [Mycolicibacterium sp. ND9-15]|uniref:hypothetical protein n=1 Tax=Mycolicibacterium sp. ND9-15 TaxID=3042320 RepID=UPI002DD9E10A|nr:hypothetical protein [Mycolicibacterium sp. ND9-15]WSE57926.1 hypothetical protein QGN32_08805 [Mycolicibacterium sp. ND9-15]
MTARHYVWVQATVAGVVNFVINPAIDWLTWRRKAPQPVWGFDGLVVNFVVTSLILSTLVGLFVWLGARSVDDDGTVSPRPWLHRLPRRGWLAGLALGAGAALVAIAASGIAHVAGVTTLSLPSLLAVKAVYCGLLGFLVARWVIFRTVA